MEIKSIKPQFPSNDNIPENKIPKKRDMYDLDLEISEEKIEDKIRNLGTASATCLGTCHSCGVTCLGTCNCA